MEKILSFFLSIVLFFTSLTGAGGSFRRSAAVAENELAAAGYELAVLLEDRCYNLFNHTLKSATDSSNMPYVWSAAAFVEMAADAYSLFPGSLKLRAVYADALNNLLPKYLTDGYAPVGEDGDPAPYYNPGAGGSGDYYYDDNAWVCIRLLQGYKDLGSKKLLEAARVNLTFLWTGWDDVLGGGVYWYMDRASKNTCSNAPCAIAFLLAYQITGEEVYLERGKMIYDWVNRTLRRADGLYADAINVSGGVNEWKGAYNQATMIYAGSLLYEITGDEAYYALAKQTVEGTLPHIFEESVSETGETTVKMRLNPIFKAWCIGWLARAYNKFYQVDPNKYTAAAERLAAVMHAELQTKNEDGLYDPFFCSGGSDPANDTELLAQCGVAASLLNAAYYETVLRP